MVRPFRSPLRWACALAALLAPKAAAAASSTYRLQLVRAEGAASCPSARLIEQDVAERLGRNPFSDQGERGIEVVLERSESKWLARLYLRIDPGDADAVRLLESEALDCSELGKSVALAVALAIAPELPPELPPKPAEPAPCEPPVVVAAPPPAPKPTLHGAVSLRALLSPNLLPSTSAGAALYVSFRGDLFGAALGGLFYPESELRGEGVHLGFGISAAFASGCLWARIKDPQIWSCIGLRAGAQHTVVYEPEPASPGDHFWWAASSELGLRQHLFERFFVEAGASAIFPLLRHRFQVDSSSAPVYQQDLAVVEGFAGFGLRLD